LGILDFTFDIFHCESYINMRWSGEKADNDNKGRQDCRGWIWDYHEMRNRVQNKEKDCFGEIFFEG